MRLGGRILTSMTSYQHMHIERDVALFPLDPKRIRLYYVLINGRVDGIYIDSFERIRYDQIALLAIGLQLIFILGMADLLQTVILR